MLGVITQHTVFLVLRCVKVCAAFAKVEADLECENIDTFDIGHWEIEYKQTQR